MLRIVQSVFSVSLVTRRSARGLLAVFVAALGLLLLAALAQARTSSVPAISYNPTFTPQYLQMLGNTRSVAVGDLDGDGRIDVVQGNV